MIASPIFKKAVLNLENNNKFTIIAKNSTPENIYIQSAKLNGEVYTKNYLLHSDIINGGEIEFVMGPSPSEWGSHH